MSKLPPMFRNKEWGQRNVERGYCFFGGKKNKNKIVILPTEIAR